MHAHYNEAPRKCWVTAEGSYKGTTTKKSGSRTGEAKRGVGGTRDTCSRSIQSAAGVCAWHTFCAFSAAVLAVSIAYCAVPDAASAVACAAPDAASFAVPDEVTASTLTNGVLIAYTYRVMARCMRERLLLQREPTMHAARPPRRDAREVPRNGLKSRLTAARGSKPYTVPS